MNPHRSKATSLTIVAGAYAVAVAAAAAWLVFGPATGQLWLDTLIADVIATVVVFAFSRAYRNSSFYDAYWSVAPPLMLFYWWSRAGPEVETISASSASGSRSACSAWPRHPPTGGG